MWLVPVLALIKAAPMPVEVAFGMYGDAHGARLREAGIASRVVPAESCQRFDVLYSSDQSPTRLCRAGPGPTARQ